MGDPNASLPTPQPRIMREMFGAYGKELSRTRITFVSAAAHCCGLKERLHLHSMIEPVRRTRQLTKEQMVLNSAMPRIDIDAETFNVYINGELATVPPAKELPLAQLYWFG
jgi:urease subunit alpha